MKRVWAIADLHLSFGVPGKKMDIFGPGWKDWTDKIEEHWRSLVAPEDLVLIAGDISWAMHLDEAILDLEWIGRLPGTKVLIKGNHDYWWGSLSKVKKILPPSCHLIQNDSWNFGEISIAGTRLWDVPGLKFGDIIDYQPSKDGAVVKPLTATDNSLESEKIYLREVARLETSLKMLSPAAKKRIVMTHYPPIGPQLEETEVSLLLEKYKVDICVFGHLHNVRKGGTLFGVKNGVTYYLTACDYLEDFRPLLIYSS